MITDNPRRQPVHPRIDEDMIRTLVHGFYARVRQDGAENIARSLQLGMFFRPERRREAAS